VNCSECNANADGKNKESNEEAKKKQRRTNEKNQWKK
jgi:hypothetical protein